VTPAAAPGSYIDPVYLEQIIKAVMSGISSATLPAIPTVAPALQDIVVALVRWVKSMRELGCEQYDCEQDVELARRWIRKVDETFGEIEVPADIRVRCAAQLSFGSAHIWWETICSKRATDVLSWMDFRSEFENKYYTKQHQKKKEQWFLALK
jgi:hypothetical protein